jgi:hypothetical protein
MAGESIVAGGVLNRFSGYGSQQQLKCQGRQTTQTRHSTMILRFPIPAIRQIALSTHLFSLITSANR